MNKNEIEKDIIRAMYVALVIKSNWKKLENVVAFIV